MERCSLLATQQRLLGERRAALELSLSVHGGVGGQDSKHDQELKQAKRQIAAARATQALVAELRKVWVVKDVAAR